MPKLPVAIVQEKETAELGLPALSSARTPKTWSPAARPLYVFGEAHAANAAPSSLHWKVTPPWASVKPNVVAVSEVGSSGCTVIVGAVGGATVQLRMAGALSGPLPDWASTRKVWLPAARPV